MPVPCSEPETRRSLRAGLDPDYDQKMWAPVSVLCVYFECQQDGRMRGWGGRSGERFAARKKGKPCSSSPKLGACCRDHADCTGLAAGVHWA